MNKKVDRWMPAVFADEIEKRLKRKSPAFRLEVMDYWYRFTKQGKAYLEERRRRGRPAIKFILDFLEEHTDHMHPNDRRDIERRVLSKLCLLGHAATNGATDE